MEQGILGFQPWAVLMFVVILFMGFWVWTIRRNQEKLRKEIGDRILAFFFTWGSQCIPVFCDEVRGEINPPEDYDGDPKNLRMIKAPKKHELDVYFVMPEFLFDMWWPLGKKRSEQIKVKCCAFVVNIL